MVIFKLKPEDGKDPAMLTAGLGASQAEGTAYAEARGRTELGV